MAKQKPTRENRDETAELLRKLLIVQLGLAGVSQPKVRTIVGGSMASVNDIMKHLKQKS